MSEDHARYNAQNDTYELDGRSISRYASRDAKLWQDFLNPELVAAVDKVNAEGGFVIDDNIEYVQFVRRHRDMVEEHLLGRDDAGQVI